MLDSNAKLKSILQCLALDAKAKAKYFPKFQREVLYVLSESGETSRSPLEFFACRSSEMLDWIIPFDPREVRWQLVHEIRDMLDLLIELPYGYIWSLKDERARISGTADVLWKVLARYAVLTLDMFGWEIKNPDLTFEELFSTQEKGATIIDANLLVDLEE